MLSDARILELMKEHFPSWELYGPLRLEDQGDGTSKFVSPKELHFAGQRLFEFARLIESEIAK